MAVARAAWGIDVGHSALKALRLCIVEDGIALDALEVIEHPQVLSEPGADRDALAGETLRRLMARVSLADCHVAVSVSGLASYSWFGHLPPIEGGAIPHLIHYEAEQQIPYPIEEAVWRWQTFRDPDQPDEPDVDAGVFAVPRAAVGRWLLLFSQAGINVDTMQTAPLALYNFAEFEGHFAEEGATMVVDAGAGEVDVVIAEGRRIWTRAIGPGGDRLTEVVAREAKLTFDQAERRKRALSDSPEDRRVASALEPVAEALAAQVRGAFEQYAGQYAASELRRVVAAGNAFCQPALAEALGKALGVPVVRVEQFRRLAPSPVAEEPRFAEHVPALAVAYGLALQELDLGTIHVDFRPPGIARQWGWRKAGPLAGLRRFIGRVLRR